MAKNTSQAYAPLCSNPMRDWLDSQSQVMKVWLDRLIEQGDPGDLISLVHRHAAWLDLMQGQLRKDTV